MSSIMKVHSLKGNTNNAIDYILDETKTDYWISGTNRGVDPSVVGMYWQSEWKENNYKGTNVGYHFIQSFDEPNLKPEQVYEIAEEWIKDCTHGEHDYVIAVHKNTKHTHAHIIVNPVNNLSGKGWDIYYKKDVAIFRELNDRVCRKYGIEVLPKPEKANSLSWYNYHQQKQGDTDLEIIRKAIDYVVPRVKDYDDFKSYLTKVGFEVEDGVRENKNVEIEKYKNYSFTINEKMVNEEFSNESYYFVRIPYSNDWFLLDRNNAEWNKNKTTLKCNVDFTKKFDIYSSNGDEVIDYGRDGYKIANIWEDKDSKGRKGLRIKPPYRTKFRRCKRIKNPDDENLDYSLEGIQERILNNGCNITDPEIEDVIYTSDNDENKTKDMRNTFYDNAQIKTKYNQSPLYQMTKKEKFFHFKTKELQEKLDNLEKRNIQFENINSLQDMKELSRSIKHELATCNSKINTIEKDFRDIQIQRMEGIIEMSDEEVENLIDKDLSSLKQERLKLKDQYSEITNRIKTTEKDINKFR